MPDLELFEIGYLRFREVENPGRKTRKVHVERKSSGKLLGVIKWYGQWRQHCFFPEPDTLFNVTCLHDIDRARIDKSLSERINQ
jgi:hypothetical protein